MSDEPDASDPVDDLLDAWRATRPDLDPGPLGVVGRVIVLAKHLERSVDAALAKHNLSLGQFDILGTLRRAGKKGGLTPGQLLQSVMRRVRRSRPPPVYLAREKLDGEIVSA